MNAGQAEVRVELSGGPFCGHQGFLPPASGTTDVYLFHAEDGVVWAYGWANRSNPKTGLWVLQSIGKMGNMGMKGGGP